MWRGWKKSCALGYNRLPPLENFSMSFTRPSGRQHDELRALTITRQYTRHAEGSVLVEFGDTRVLCTASIEERVPPFLRNKKRGWVTAEYGMLPRATTTRNLREATHGRQGGRTLEIQRLIGRALRAALDLSALGERSILIDCDVIQADGGTRCAAICGGYLALVDAVEWLLHQDLISQNPMRRAIGAVSVGVVENEVITDLDYAEDNRADTDMNVVMDNSGGIIEIQGTAESAAFDRAQLNRMLDHAAAAIESIFAAQRDALKTQPNATGAGAK